MPKLKLTKAAIDRLPAPDPSGRQTPYWDTELKGFGVLVSGTKATKSFVVQRDLPGGLTRRLTIMTFPELNANGQTIEDVRRQAADILIDMRRGNDPKAAARSGTLRAVLNAYLDPGKGKASLSERSRAIYREDIERHLKSWLDLPLASITRDMVEDRHREIAREIAAGGRYSGHATANRTFVVLRALWTWAARRDERLPTNPVAARLAGNWHRVERRDGLVKASELPAFFKAVKQLPNAVARDYILLLLFTGMRRREAAGLTWQMIDFDEGVIRLPASATKAKRKLDLPLTDFVRKLLADRRKLGDSEYVFPAASKSRHIEEPKFPLAEVAEATGIKVSAHDLRRTFVTVAESTDISPLALKALVNHALPGSDITSGYVQMAADRLREPAQKVADRLKALCKVKGRLTRATKRNP